MELYFGPYNKSIQPKDCVEYSDTSDDDKKQVVGNLNDTHNNTYWQAIQSKLFFYPHHLSF